MIDEDFLDAQAKPTPVRPYGRTTEVAFFIKSLELYGIVNSSLLQLYMSPKERKVKENDFLTSILQLNSRLTQWARSIPQQLSCAHTSTDEDFLFQRQCIVLRARQVSRFSSLVLSRADRIKKISLCENTGSQTNSCRVLSQAGETK
jgi:hypothetical protein